jgi:hypothetical protein
VSSLWSEQRVEGARPQLPIEDLDAGLYIHPGTVTVAAFLTEGEESSIDPEKLYTPRYYVDARDFMDMQKERDDLKRTLALVNATRVGPVDDDARLRRIFALCDKAGFGVDEARAIAGIEAWARSEPKP